MGASTKFSGFGRFLGRLSLEFSRNSLLTRAAFQFFKFWAGWSSHQISGSFRMSLCDTDSSTVLDACSASFSSNHNILSIFEFVPEMLQTDDSNANEDSSKMCCDGS